MKNLFAIYKNLDELNYKKFFIRQVSEESNTKLQNLCEEHNTLRKQKLPPNWLFFVGMLFFVFGIAGLVGFLKAFINSSFKEVFDDRGALFIVCIVLTILGFAIIVYTKAKAKNSNKDPEVQQHITNFEKTVKECMFELEIPESSVPLDIVFPIMKKDKNGEDKLSQTSLVQYLNRDLDIFVEKDLLCFGFADAVVGVPLNSIKGIKRINKRMTITEWHKKEAYNSPKYKEYKMYVNGAGFIWCRWYYEIDLDINGEEYYFLLLPYEIDSFKKIVGEDIPVIE